MEGKFYRYKTPHHPHTNMAKAGLNMLTRTSSVCFPFIVTPVIVTHNPLPGRLR